MGKDGQNLAADRTPDLKFLRRVMRWRRNSRRSDASWGSPRKLEESEVQAEIYDSWCTWITENFMVVMKSQGELKAWQNEKPSPLSVVGK